MATARASHRPPPRPPRRPRGATSRKVLTGIAGFDEISGGGIPRARTTLIVGGAGCGKTVFALQTLVNHASQSGEAAIFVAFEEEPQQIIANASEFGWDLPRLIRRKVFFLDAQLSPDIVQVGDFDLIGMLERLRRKAIELRATVIVFDGIDVLLTLLDNPAAARRELYRIRDWLSTNGLTCIITQKSTGVGRTRPLGVLQFMVDCVVVLDQQVESGSTFRSLRIMKFRGSGFKGDEFPIEVMSKGMVLTDRGPMELSSVVSTERVPTGLPRLDEMLQGGYQRGSNVVISGAPGTAKSTLAALFAVAACARGERTLYVSFNEGTPQLVRNLRSVNVRLTPHIRSGILTMHSVRTSGPNIAEQFNQLRAKVLEVTPRCVIIDPLSALSTKTAHLASADATSQFLDFLKTSHITAVSASVSHRLSGDDSTSTAISTIADTWIHLTNLVEDGERIRTLSIVKSRGTGHSNQVRELKLADSGVTLADVFTARGAVLMGAARWESERADADTDMHAHLAATRERIALQIEQRAATARLLAIKAELEERSAERSAERELMGSTVDAAADLPPTPRPATRRSRRRA